MYVFHGEIRENENILVEKNTLSGVTVTFRAQENLVLWHV